MNALLDEEGAMGSAMQNGSARADLQSFAQSRFEDFGAGGATGSGGGFIYSARFSGGWVSLSMTEVFSA